MSPEPDATEPIVRSSRAPERTPAGVRRRAAAYLLDLVLVGGVAVTVASRSERSPGRGAVAASALALVGGTLYHVVLEGATGRTAGKAIADIGVVRENGAPCDYRAAWIRTALRAVDWLPLGYVVGLVSIRLTDRSQRLGDLAAGTVVVRDSVDGEDRGLSRNSE